MYKQKYQHRGTKNTKIHRNKTLQILNILTFNYLFYLTCCILNNKFDITFSSGV